MSPQKKIVVLGSGAQAIAATLGAIDDAAPGSVDLVVIPVAFEELIAPAALPDPFAAAILIGTIVAMMAFRVGAFKVMIGGAVLGVLRSQLPLTVLTRHF